MRTRLIIASAIAAVAAGFLALSAGASSAIDVDKFRAAESEFAQFLRISVDQSGGYKPATLAAMALQLNESGVPMDDAIQATILLIKSGSDQGETIKLLSVAQRLASLQKELFILQVHDLAAAFSNGIEGVRRLDGELNFLTVYQYEHLKALARDGKFATLRRQAIIMLWERVK